MASKNAMQNNPMSAAHLRPIRVCIDARFSPKEIGGAGVVAIGLASAFARLCEGDEEFYFLTYPDRDEHIAPFVSGRCKILNCVLPRHIRPEPQWRRTMKRIPGLRAAWHALHPHKVVVPVSDGTAERAGMDLIHFTTQGFWKTSLPTIYHPQDLQHIHHPEFLNETAVAYREVMYRTACDESSLVVAMTAAGKRDLIVHFGLAPNKICIAPYAPLPGTEVMPSSHELTATRGKFALPEAFIFYPAHTYPHKNHIQLLDVLALLRDRHGIKVPLVCSGSKHEFFGTIRDRACQLKLEDQVQFLEFITTDDLRCVYHLCRCMVFPSLVEGWGLPICEAFAAGAPVACSSLDTLMEQAGDAAVFFDPTKTEDVLGAVHRLWDDDGLRNSLKIRGKRRAELFTWSRTARIFLAHYRRLAGRLMKEDDRLLFADPSFTVDRVERLEQTEQVFPTGNMQPSDGRNFDGGVRTGLKHGVDP